MSSGIRCRSTSSACARCASSWPRTRPAPTSTGWCRKIAGSPTASTTASPACSRHSLGALGVQRGDRVALVSANVPEWVITWWACAILGATLVPLNAWWKAEELEFGLARLRGEGAHRRLARASTSCATGSRHCPRSSTSSSSTVRATKRCVRSPSWSTTAAIPACRSSPIDEDDVLAILYTSGTTGKPKGATVSHRQAIANVQNIIVMGVAQAMRGTPPPEAAAGLQSGVAARRPAVPRDRMSVDDDARVRHGRQGRVDAGRPLRSRRLRWRRSNARR